MLRQRCAGRERHHAGGDAAGRTGRQRGDVRSGVPPRKARWIWNARMAGRLTPVALKATMEEILRVLSVSKIGDSRVFAESVPQTNHALLQDVVAERRTGENGYNAQ